MLLGAAPLLVTTQELARLTRRGAVGRGDAQRRSNAIVDGEGDVVYRRRSTNLPAGRKVSEQWDAEVRAVLDSLIR